MRIMDPPQRFLEFYVVMYLICCSVSGSVVALVPAFNEDHYLASVLVRLRECVDRVIVCDDGSVDLTGG